MRSVLFASLLLVACGGSVVGSDAPGASSDELRWPPIQLAQKCTLVPVIESDPAAAASFARTWAGNGILAQLTATGGALYHGIGWDPGWFFDGTYERSNDVIRWGGHILPYGGDWSNGTFVGYTEPGPGCDSVSGSVEAVGVAGVFGREVVRIAATGNYTPRSALYLYREVHVSDGAEASLRLRFVRRDDSGQVVTDFMLR
jgi:hypothetical protein